MAAPAPIYPTQAQAKVTSVDRPWLALVCEADPEWQAVKHREIQYEMTGRRFYGDPYHLGPYGGGDLLIGGGPGFIEAAPGVDIAISK